MKTGAKLMKFKIDNYYFLQTNKNFNFSLDKMIDLWYNKKSSGTFIYLFTYSSSMSDDFLKLNEKE